MLSELSVGPLIFRYESENKEKLIKIITNMIKKLKISSGLEKQKCFTMVCRKFNMVNAEEYLITKLRMLLIQLGAGIDLLQIRKPDTRRTNNKQPFTADKYNIVEHKLESDAESLSHIQETKSLPNIKVKVNVARKQTPTRKSRKSLECRQLEKLNKKDFAKEIPVRNPESKMEFLRIFNLEPHVI